MEVNRHVNLFFRFDELLIEINQLNTCSIIIMKRICVFWLAYFSKYQCQLKLN